MGAGVDLSRWKRRWEPAPPPSKGLNRDHRHRACSDFLHAARLDRAALPRIRYRGVARVMIQVGFTGTRHGMTDAQKVTLRSLLTKFGGVEFHHGDCIGADSEAHDIAMECGYCPIIHPPTNPALRAWRKVPSHLMRPERPYMTRNRDIVDAAQVIIATPAEMLERNGGTWSTVRYARRVGKPLHVILPDGSVVGSLTTLG